MPDPRWPDDTRRLLAQILAGVRGEDAELRALHDALRSAFDVPAGVHVIGEPVEVLAIEYDGNARRGLTARCRRAEGGIHVVSACEVELPAGSPGARHIAAYRAWVGLSPHEPDAPPSSRPQRAHKASESDLDLSRPVELVVLAPKERAARCRILGTGREITLRSGDVWRMVPGEIITVAPRKQWSYGRHPYLSGDVESMRLDAAALRLVPLRLQGGRAWDPAREYWGEEGDERPAWADAIMARGPRESFEMEQVYPRGVPDDIDDDPILEASELNETGDRLAAERILCDMLVADLRCLDAHAHLGNFAFDTHPQDAIRHYAVGVRIGEQALGDDFEGVLPWGMVDNRPFLRCMHGYGLCLWRLGRRAEAAAVFERMLWLNPVDNQGARFVLSDVRRGDDWEDRVAT